MFCPYVNGKCKNNCRFYKGDDCLIAREKECIVKGYEALYTYIPVLKQIMLFIKIDLKRIIEQSELISPEQKEALERSFMSKDAEVAENILKQAGLT